MYFFRSGFDSTSASAPAAQRCYLTLIADGSRNQCCPGSSDEPELSLVECSESRCERLHVFVVCLAEATANEPELTPINLICSHSHSRALAFIRGSSNTPIAVGVTALTRFPSIVFHCSGRAQALRPAWNLRYPNDLTNGFSFPHPSCHRPRREPAVSSPLSEPQGDSPGSG